MNGIAPELFGKGADGRIIILLAGLGLFTWLIAEVVSMFNPKLAGQIKMVAALVGALMVFGLGKKVINTILAGVELIAWLNS